MVPRRGKWIGFVVSGLCFGLIALAIFSTQTSSIISDQLFGRLCHQFGNRCYHIHGAALPICVRCVWIYLGLAIGHILFLYWKPETNRITHLLIGAIALMFFDVVLRKWGSTAIYFGREV